MLRMAYFQTGTISVDEKSLIWEVVCCRKQVSKIDCHRIWQGTVILWSNLSSIRSGGWEFKSRCCRVPWIKFFQRRVPLIFISRKEMESSGRREEMESGNLIWTSISCVAIKQYCHILRHLVVNIETHIWSTHKRLWGSVWSLWSVKQAWRWMPPQLYIDQSWINKGHQMPPN